LISQAPTERRKFYWVPSQIRMPHSLGLCEELAVTPLNQLRLRLTDHDFQGLMQAAKPLPVSERNAFL
jgi:hypothetical protein